MSELRSKPSAALATDSVIDPNRSTKVITIGFGFHSQILLRINRQGGTGRVSPRPGGWAIAAGGGLTGFHERGVGRKADGPRFRGIAILLIQ